MKTKALAEYLFAIDPEVQEAVLEWFRSGSFQDLKDRLEYLRERAHIDARKGQEVKTDE